MLIRCAFVLLALAACGSHKPGGMSGPSMNNKMSGPALAPAVSPVVSSDILAREPVANRAQVKHILIGWKDLADAYGGNIDPRAEARDKAAAEAQVSTLMGQLKAGGNFDMLKREHSEDRGSAQSDTPIDVAPDAGLVIEFRQLALRLNPGEWGVCQTDYGFHIIKRVGS